MFSLKKHKQGTQQGKKNSVCYFNAKNYFKIIKSEKQEL